MISNIEGHRKLWIAVLAEFMSYSLAVIGVLDGSSFVSVTGLVVGLFAAGNVGEAIASRRSTTQGENRNVD